MNALVYIRRSKDFDEAVLDFAKRYAPLETVVTVSEYFNGDLRINMNTKQWDSCSKTQKFIDENLDISEIIFRDRVLRNTPHFDCLTLIRRATGEILNIFSQGKYKSLVMYPVDNYIMDILVRVAQFNGVEIYGVCNFFMKDYKRITTYGEHNPIREPVESEVESAVAALKNNFKSHMAPNRKKAVRSAVLRYLKYKLRYPVFYLIGAKILKRKEYDLLATPYITTVRKFSNFFVERFFTKAGKINFSKNSIFVPLHYFPEATIEYWSGDIRQVEFEQMLLCKIDDLSSRYDQIILKEHPATVFDNSSQFYKSILMNPKVILIDPFMSTSDILKKIEVVGVWTGTVGIEALVNGKKVELFSDKQYYKQALSLQYGADLVVDGLCSIKDGRALVHEVLKGCVPVEHEP